MTQNDTTISRAKRRVLITAWLQGAGGIETHLLTLSRLLVKNGAEVTIAARVCKAGVPLEAEAANIPITFLKTPFSRSPRFLKLSTAWAMLCWLPRFRRHFDAILAFEHSNFTKLLRQCLKPGGFIIAAYAGELPRAPQANSIRRSCDALLVESDIHREAFRRLSGEKFPIRVAPHLGHYAAPPARDAFHKEALRIAFLGRFDRAKGVHQLLDTWPTLQLGNAELHFYGDGPERQAMAQRISKQSIVRVFLHRGWTGAKELAAILGEVDLLVLPSSSEGLPLVLLEAMAHGVPFVATDVGAVSILAHGNPDVMVAPREADFGASIQEMAARIRNGSVQPRRLQRYFDERFSFTRSGQIWLNALLHPQTFWTEEIDRPASRRA